MKRRSMRVAILASITMLLALVVGVVGQVTVHPQAAGASVTGGDIVFIHQYGSDPSQIYIRNGSTGVQTNLSNDSTDDTAPDVSPDGSRIAFNSNRPGTNGSLIYVMNSDGSGQVAISSHALYIQDYYSRWSPDGKKLTFERDDSGGTNIFVVNADGSGSTQLTTDNASYGPAAWSPDGTKIVYGHSGVLYVMNANGSNQHQVGSGVTEADPIWSPDGTRIYHDVGAGGIRYYTSTDSFATTTNAMDHALTSGYADFQPTVSASGSTVAFMNTDRGGGCCVLYSVGSGGGTVTPLTVWDANNSLPSYVRAVWPSAPPSNSTATFSAPSPSDAPYTRQVTVSLSATGNQRFDLGWSTSSTTAPNTSYLQTITNMSTKKGPINFLGKLSGSTYNGGTLPDADWYLWVRSVKTNGTANAWATPLLVHTPKAPIWVGAGDSYSSGHHQTADERYCPAGIDIPFFPNTPPCGISGAPHVVPNDASASWVTTAVATVNSNLHVPTAWQMQPVVIAQSGAATSSFGASGAIAGTTAWAAGGQAGQLSTALYPRYDSWNVVSVTGGADDTPWVNDMRTWYINNFIGTYTPWAPGSVGNCPNTEDVYQSLTSNSGAVNSAITTNLQGMVTVAANASPGVRALMDGYPYVVDLGSTCYADWGVIPLYYHGVKSVIDQFKADQTAVIGSRVKFVDNAAAFGASPVTDGYISTNRLYGYPHPSTTGSPSGQTKMAGDSTTVLLGSGW